MKWNGGKPCGVEPDARRRVASSTLLSATPTALLRDVQTLGRLFESLVIRDLRVFVSTFPGMGYNVSHYRDDKGLEVDSIVEHAGRWAGIEIELSDAKGERPPRASKDCAKKY